MMTGTALDETSLRRKLGIPPDARQVLVFAESSHWDPNWLRTSQEYFQQLVAPGLEQVVCELRADQRRVFSLECMFFLRLFWESRPDLQDELRELLNTRRLRLTGSGVTTPDTLLPADEAILRDLLIGQEWLRSVGVTQEPRLAYFPDCFGHSPRLPSLLNAAGFDRSAVTRIDGMWFLSADLDLPFNFPLRGSSAEILLKRERCLDFTWRSADGAQVLCHWNAFTYGQGDMLAYSGQARIYLYPSLARPDPSDRNVARRIGEYLRQLAPLSRTPYLFCPIGWDFNPPIPGLGALLDRYNRAIYPSSGVWLLNAGMDDYFDLIEPYRASLPSLELDPNPYWTGFYTSRPALKQRAFRLADRLGLCERLSLVSASQLAGSQLAGNQQEGCQPAELGPAWWSAAVSNHHDFITGTSPDRVAYEEQVPMLETALAKTGQALEGLQAGLQARLEARLEARSPLLVNPAGNKTPPAKGMPECNREGEALRLVTRHYDLTLSSLMGGQLSRLERSGSGEPLLAGPGHALVQYNESGGLWRMGYEYRGGSFREANHRIPPVEFSICEQGAYLCISWKTQLPGEIIEQALWLSQDDPLIYFRAEGRALQKSTLVLRYALPFHPGELRMEAPGGDITRPAARVYARPFWPIQRYLYLPEPSGGTGFALLNRYPAAATVNPDGHVEVIVLRNAIREKAYFNRFNLLGMPATGIERERAAFYGALVFPRSAEEAHSLPTQSRQLLTAPWASAEDRLMAQVTTQLAEVSSDQVFITALKPAWRGEGVILRLSAPSAPLEPVRVRWKLASPRQAWLCDARERDLEPIAVEGQDLIVPVQRSIVTVRVLS